ncbi:isomerase [Streptomyces sp. CB03234]|uniref:5-carboxymethyl-2-hydroxymuconate Delta-isomerase n=1 Tax=Streptomyces sp. (strain CB03234) TaxID=1703937 RepID=UPI0009401378|nr:5-carboxymethyl-2-hydroxymuconate Delta-isomerase [Streptomyces sp. CB03234]OKK08223.1 isomerase [Streptomyces sp. CB03234]
MPQITVDYSASLDEDFDRRGFALALHPLVVEAAGARLAACKTRTRRAEDTVIGDGTADDALVHVGVGLLAGRSDEVKARLTEAVLALVPEYIKPAEGRVLHISAEVEDLDASYRSS